MYLSVNISDLEYNENDLLEMAEKLGALEKTRFLERVLLKHYNPKEIIRIILQSLDCDSSANLLDELRGEFLSFAEYRERAERLNKAKLFKNARGK